mgnify:FL=1
MEIRMSKFTNVKFVDTAHYSAESKREWCDDMIRFIENGCKERSFTNEMYRHASNTFGHVAHHNRSGFYHAWFSNPEKIKEYALRCVKSPIYGYPSHTFCDAEQALQDYLLSDEGAGLMNRLYQDADIHVSNVRVFNAIENLKHMSPSDRAKVLEQFKDEVTA